MKTLCEYISVATQNADALRISLGDFIDDFRREKNISVLTDEANEPSPVNQLFVATAHQLCIEMKINAPEWIRKPVILNEPYFLSQFASFRFLALRDSPYAFKIRNIFVNENFLKRA
jgi:hypothetical protein